MEIEYFQFNEGTKMGINTLENKVIIPAIYDFVEPFSDGLFNVSKDDAHAYFDNNGKIIIPFQNKYESYGNFTEGLACVCKDEKWGYIDKTGQEIIKPQFHFAEEFSNDLAIVRNSDGKHGATNKAGKLIIDYNFDLLSKFKNGYARFGDLETYGLIDKSGKIIIPQEYVHIGDVENNKVTVQIKEGENYKEGVWIIGDSIVWNNNLDQLNEFIHKRKQFILLCEEIIKTMYSEGCPCEYQRFRNFIEWEQPISFLDQEALFSVFSKYLEEVGNNSFKCKTCGTTYNRTWEEYSINLQVINIKIAQTGSFIEKGAKLKSTIPVSLGFRGYNLDKLREIYKQSDNTAVINYLKEKI
jgi:hypothetical protein